MESSCTICFATTRKPNLANASATAGPEISTREPRAQESLTVITAAVKPAPLVSTVEEDIFLLFLLATTARCSSRFTANSRGHASARGTLFRRFPTAVALRFVQ